MPLLSLSYTYMFVGGKIVPTSAAGVIVTPADVAHLTPHEKMRRMREAATLGTGGIDYGDGQG